MRLKYALAGLLIIVAASTNAGELHNLDAVQQLTENAMKALEKENHQAGYEILKSYWPMPAAEIDRLADETESQWPTVSQRFGSSLGSQFVKREEVGDSLARFTYLQKFDRHALRWVFVFYKPQGQWLVNTVYFDDQLEKLFDE